MKLLDTDVCIEILRGNRLVIERRRTVPDDVATSWITACELAYGAARSSRPRENRVVVEEFLSTLPVYGLDRVATRWFGELKAQLERGARTVADADLYIAAIALAQGAELVTGNLRHYGRIPDLVLEDWLR